LTCTDGNDNCANPVAGEDAAQKFPAIAEKKRDPVAPYHVAGFKTRADLSDQVVKFPIGDGPILYDRRPLRKTPNQVIEHVGKRQRPL